MRNALRPMRRSRKLELVIGAEIGHCLRRKPRSDVQGRTSGTYLCLIQTFIVALTPDIDRNRLYFAAQPVLDMQKSLHYANQL